MERIENFINGKLIEPVNGQYLDNFEPATGIVYSQVPDSDENDLKLAVDAAKNAFEEWSNTPAEKRAKVLNRLADLVDENRDDLVRAESIDNGKPLSLAGRVDVPRASANFRFFAAAILHSKSELHYSESLALNYTLRRPRGVVGSISPWNLPLYILTWKISPALATGNTVIAKPSEITPMTAYKLSRLCNDAGLPQGVLNIVHGTGQKIGSALVSHPDVPTISFTGGTATGEAIARTAAPMFKKLSLEMGGKNPNIVFDDADYQDALEGSMKAAFTNQGEICLCGSRLFVHEKIYNRFLDDFVSKTKQLKVGDPLSEGTDLGAVVSKQHYKKILSCIELAREEGGQILCGGKKADDLPERCKDGYFVQPTVITGLETKCRTNQEEIFGPVVTVIPFKSEDEVIEMANSTRYGLSASIWTTNLNRAHRVAEKIQSGTVWINCWMIRDLRVPFGGMKHSGVGREGGEESLRFFTEPKNICIKTNW